MTTKRGSYVDFVVLVDATLHTQPHWDRINTLYLVPALKCLSCQVETVDDRKSNRYVLVLFHSADQSPLVTSRMPPCKTVNSFLALLNSIQFKGGAGEYLSYVSEGMATALQVFRDLKLEPRDGDVKRFCFLISSTLPYQMSSVVDSEFSPVTYLQLAGILKDMKVKLSVLCPSQIESLRQIYLVNNCSMPQINFSKHRDHMILLSGFEVKKKNIESSSLNHKATNSPMMMEHISSVLVDVNSTGEQAPSLPCRDILRTVLPNHLANVDLTSHSPITMTASIPTLNNVIDSSQTSFSAMQSGSFTMKQPIELPTTDTLGVITSDMIIDPSRMSLPHSTSANPSMLVKREFYSPGIYEPQVPGHENVNHTRTEDLKNTKSSRLDQNCHQIRQRRHSLQTEAAYIITCIKTGQKSLHSVCMFLPHAWSGTLEWMQAETQPRSSLQTNSTIVPFQCSMYYSTAKSHTQPIVNTNYWSKKLSFQIVSNNFISCIKNYSSDCRKLLFDLEPHYLAKDLFLQIKNHGIGIISVSTLHSSEVVLRIFLYVLHDQTDNIINFKGIIPNDQAGVATMLQSNGIISPDPMTYSSYIEHEVISQNDAQLFAQGTSMNSVDEGINSQYQQTNPCVEKQINALPVPVASALHVMNTYPSFKNEPSGMRHCDKENNVPGL